MEELLSELKDACRSEPSPSAAETIGRGESTWFSGRPAHAPAGTIALALSDDARVIINEGDVRAVEKQGEHYSVAVSADTYVLLRIDKLLKATPQQGGDTIVIGPVTVCDIVCGDVVIGGIRFWVCVPVNCRCPLCSRKH